MSDSLGLIYSINTGNDVPWEIVNLLSSIRQLLSCFDVIKFHWISRDRNQDAHDLGQMGMSLPDQDLCIFEKRPLD